MAKTSRIVSSDHRHLLGLAALTVAIFVAMSLARPGLFLTGANMQSMAFQFPEYAILALAMMTAMLTGGIDLSIIGTANLSSILAALAMTALFPTGGNAVAVLALALLVGLSVGCLCGVINGLFIAGIGLPPILATLGTGIVYTGIGVVVTGGSAVVGLPDSFAVLGNAAVWAVPVPLLVFAAVAVVMAFVLNRTIYGHSVYLFGTNPRASRFAGLKNGRLNMTTYMISGTLAALAGLILISRANSAKADYAESYLLITVLIAVLGGTNPYGGVGRVLGVVLAVLSLQFLSSGLNMLQVSNFAKEFVWGLTLLLAMSVTRIEWRRMIDFSGVGRGRSPNAATGDKP
ncbi:monosaccharide ABC transporter membrane protein, CUT2 family [Tranquillimonas rosea]|uniref:Monosaccharide ABC transporter membrane protein, CUT2 family n=1 Tax=Tranquillimonas rosea TaxID=641238 RepID=A0A1H9VDN7_9RHOB|nr:ABC transporter permease [Tranquillimonas rosea]SES19679.1 monosaccharide ABC transporter membrane protein, CUT2 family [Tranquillimonas rosea]